MAHLEISSAIVSHLAWKTKVRNFLRTKDPSGIITDAHQCQLGKWLDKDGREYFKNTPNVFTDVFNKHIDVHHLCGGIIFDPTNQNNIDAWDKKSEELLTLLGSLK
jgi:hypothetical protein